MHFRSSSLHCLTAAFPSWSLALCWILFPHSNISHSDAKQLLKQALTIPLTMSLLVPLPVLLIPIPGSASPSALAHICKIKWGTSAHLNIADKYRVASFCQKQCQIISWYCSRNLRMGTSLKHKPKRLLNRIKKSCPARFAGTALKARLQKPIKSLKRF